MRKSKNELDVGSFHLRTIPDADDSQGKTILQVSSLNKEVADELKSVKGKANVSKVVGMALAKKALEKNIQQVVFDRGGHVYHGRLKAFAEGAREGGLKF